jgi:membrane protease YdiL (CAAX protease family)
LIFTIIGAVIAGLIYGMPDLLKFFTGDLSANLSLTKFIQIASSIGMFIIPALFFARLESKNWQSYLKLNAVSSLLAVLTIVIMYFSVPLLELSVEINKSMELPGFLQELEGWMRRQEDQMAELTRQLLTMKTVGSLLINLFMLAIIPAIGEEFIFRGCLQRLFKQLTSNHHIAIWLTAFIFSAIHMQFYGFLPRMLLGAMFGYLLVWSNSLWLPILAHFVNNATAVVTAYVYQQQGKSLEQLDQPERSHWLVYLISLALTIVLLWNFYQRAKTPGAIIKNGDGTRLG